MLETLSFIAVFSYISGFMTYYVFRTALVEYTKIKKDRS